jgi:hypothetical protein
MFDVQRSFFLLTRHMEIAKDKVSFSIWLAAFQASGGAYNLNSFSISCDFMISPPIFSLPEV